MELNESELAQAKARIAAAGQSSDDFAFAMEYLPPDPDGGGMFTVQYEVHIAHAKSGKSKRLIGGIGMGWVERFADALEQGFFA